MIKANYHSHTKWCGHATLSAEDNVKLAIERGLKIIGISEHTDLPDYISKFRLENPDAALQYIEEVNKLKEKYKGQIEVLCGLECENIDQRTHLPLVDWSKTQKDIEGVDYVLMAAHSYRDGKHVFVDPPSSRDMLEKYVQDIDSALASGHFVQMAHPDGFLKGLGKWTDDALWAAEEITKSAAKHNVPLGINVNGWSYGIDFCYPNLKFFQIAAKNGAKCIIELDAHEPEIYGEDLIQKTLDLAKEAGVILLDELDISK